MAKSRPTMHDVAEVAGVSLKTVSRVVNDEHHIHPKTRDRVNAAIASLGFRPNELARSLRPGRSSSTIGLLIEDIANPFYSAIARGVEEIAHTHNYMVVIASNEKSAARERELIGALVRRRVEGMLIVPASHDHAYLRAEIDMGVPAIFIDRPPEHLETDAILLDNRGGARAGVENLLRQGHRRIAYIGGDPNVYTGTERLAGYRDAFAAHGIPCDDSMILLGRHDIAQAESASYELLALPNAPTAVFADNNRMTVGVLRAIRTWKRQTVVVGFDNIELADMLPFPITVITHDPLAMGRIATTLLFSRLEGDERPPQRLIIPTKLTIYSAAEPVASTP